MTRNESVIPPAEGISIDAVDDMAGFWDTPGSAATPRMHFRRGNGGVFSAQPFYTLAGGAAMAPVDAVGLGRQLNPGAAQTHSAQAPFGIPLGRDLTLLPASARISRRYVWDFAFRRTTVFAGVQCEVGLKDDALELADASTNGIILQSLSTLNAGRWTLQTKRLGGGGVVTGADSGVAPALAGDVVPWQNIRFDYRDTTAPQLIVSVNGVVLYTVAGLLNLPIANTGEGMYWLTITSGGAANPGLGANERIFVSRFFVQELEPYPLP